MPQSPSYQHVLAASLSQTEAAQFDVSWKVPAILYYAKRNYHTRYDLRSMSSVVRTVSLPIRHRGLSWCLLLCVSVKNPIDASVLLTEASLARKQRKSHATFIPLMVSEMPQAGDLVGLDAEFVTLNQVSPNVILYINSIGIIIEIPKKKKVAL